jgi:hypothetical protein
MPYFVFRSTAFVVEPFEDQVNTPGVYGKQLALWIRDRLRARKYRVGDEVIPQGGWEVTLLDVPYPFWVECANLVRQSTNEWCVFVNAEPGFFRRTFSKAAVQTSIEAVEAELEEIFAAEADITDLRKQDVDPYR